MKNALINNIISYIILATVFITGGGFTDIGFTIYWYYPFYILFVVYGILIYRVADIKVVSVFIVIVLYSVLTYQYGLNLVVKQLINIGFSFAVFYYFIVHERFDLVGIFEKYISVAKIVLLIGFIQVMLFSVGLGSVFTFVFPYLKNYSVTIRLQSIADEPSYIGLTFVPVVFLSLHNLFHRNYYLIGKWWSILFCVGYLMTLSSVAYIGMLIMLCLLYVKNFSYRKLQFVLFIFLGIFLAGLIAYRSISYVETRVDDTLYGLSRDFGEGDTYLKVNYSTYAILSNLYVTRKSFEQNPFTGTGLGTHELAHEKYMPYRMRDFRFFALNSQDANSMGLRLISETGLVGFLLFCLFVLRYRVRSNSSFSGDLVILWILNASIFVFICLCILRNGNYTVHGKILFFLLYYYSYKEINRLLNSPKESALAFLK